jgi:hypothetical protein
MRCAVKLPCILAKVAATAAGMHKDLLHVLNNDQTFAINDKKIDLALTPILWRSRVITTQELKHTNLIFTVAWSLHNTEVFLSTMNAAT